MGRPGREDNVPAIEMAAGRADGVVVGTTSVTGTVSGAAMVVGGVVVAATAAGDAWECDVDVVDRAGARPRATFAAAAGEGTPNGTAVASSAAEPVRRSVGWRPLATVVR